MKKTYLEPNMFIFFPDTSEDILTLSNGGEGDGMTIKWKESGLN